MLIEENRLYGVRKGSNDRILEHMGCAGMPQLHWLVLGFLHTSCEVY